MQLTPDLQGELRTGRYTDSDKSRDLSAPTRTRVGCVNCGKTFDYLEIVDFEYKYGYARCPHCWEVSIYRMAPCEHEILFNRRRNLTAS
jgi:DNA-directed RNA polymerase subunit RPC12/RpoP